MEFGREAFHAGQTQTQRIGTTHEIVREQVLDVGDPRPLILDDHAQATPFCVALIENLQRATARVPDGVLHEFAHGSHKTRLIRETEAHSLRHFAHERTSAHPIRLAQDRTLQLRLRVAQCDVFGFLGLHSTPIDPEAARIWLFIGGKSKIQNRFFNPCATKSCFRFSNLYCRVKIITVERMSHHHGKTATRTQICGNSKQKKECHANFRTAPIAFFKRPAPSVPIAQHEFASQCLLAKVLNECTDGARNSKA